MNVSLDPLPATTGGSIFARKIQAGRNTASDLQAYAQELQRSLRIYPPQQFGKPARFVSERQRRFVLASIREGSIRVPRSRTGDLARGWVVSALQSVRGSFSVSVSNAVSYAPIVQGRRIYQPGTRDMQERNWRNWEAVAIGLLRKYRDRMRARIRSA